MSNITSPINPGASIPKGSIKEPQLSEQETKILRRFLDLVRGTDQPMPSNKSQGEQLFNSLSTKEKELLDVAMSGDEDYPFSPLDLSEEETIKEFLDKTGKTNQSIPSDHLEFTWLVMNLPESEVGLLMELTLKKNPSAFKLF